MKILIVDDVAVNRKILGVTLEAEGHTVLQEANGVDALVALDRESVDAVISDILMPKMDGFRLCHELRRREDLKGVAFIHYTSTYTSQADRQLSKTVGADNYLTKPISTKVLLEALEVAIRHADERNTSASKSSDTTFVMKEYSVALVKKLEEKNRELEQAVGELREANQSLNELKESLEQRVHERTAELETSNRDLQNALSEVKELAGLLPMCAWCKKIKDTDEYWHEVSVYIGRHTKAEFTHGICPECLKGQIVGLRSNGDIP